MFRMMTLDAAHVDAFLENRGEKTALPDRSTIDVLCCQSLAQNREGRAAVSDLLAGRLGLTCSCFAAARHPSEQGATAGGLALLTGGGIWVLNSGSFTVGEHQQETTVQFAVIRKGNASVLVLNLHLADVAPIRKKLLATLFTHALLQGVYSAVALCADRPAALRTKEWQALTASSKYGPQRVDENSSGGMLCLLKARSAPTATITVLGSDCSAFPGMALAFDVQRISSETISRPLFPLSFREQWLGYREHRAPA